MVLESLSSPIRAVNTPWKLFFIGALYSSIAIFLGNWIFREYSSIISVFLTSLACVPLLVSTFKAEEEKETHIESEAGILRSHSRIISYMTFLFLGFVFSYSLWYLLLPASLVQNLFKAQTLTIQSINMKITGDFYNVQTLTLIFLNNLKVLIFCILFAFLYGAGGIFILSWNASVISTAIGNFIRTRLAEKASLFGFSRFAAYFQIISLGLLRYLTHGIFEMMGYFIGGLAGGIISAAVIKEKFGTRNFEKVILDTSDLILIAVLFLIMAALIEVYITPLLF
ncbi:hypothetical protein GF336_07115 [Candidatus Woesearchaeota archaeon]|nr:hypothetical protein [Candidatus Woesearchaeota archaeon]